MARSDTMFALRYKPARSRTCRPAAKPLKNRLRNGVVGECSWDPEEEICKDVHQLYAHADRSRHSSNQNRALPRACALQRMWLSELRLTIASYFRLWLRSAMATRRGILKMNFRAKRDPSYGRPSRWRPLSVQVAAPIKSKCHGCDECPDCFSRDGEHICLTVDRRCRRCGFREEQP